MAALPASKMANPASAVPEARARTASWLHPLFRQHLKHAFAKPEVAFHLGSGVCARIECLAVLGLGGASSLGWFELSRSRAGGCRTRGALSRRIRNSWTRFVSGCSGGGSRTRGTWVRCGVVGRAVEGRAAAWAAPSPL